MNRALQWKLIAGFILVFIAGGMTGAFLGGVHARHLFFEFHQPGVMATRMRDRLRTELHLTPEQVAKISPIIETNRRATSSLVSRSLAARIYAGTVTNSVEIIL